jgi:hypothetical protein
VPRSTLPDLEAVGACRVEADFVVSGGVTPFRAVAKFVRIPTEPDADGQAGVFRFRVVRALGSNLVSTMNVLASPGTSRSQRRGCHSVSHSTSTGLRQMSGPAE